MHTKISSHTQTFTNTLARSGSETKSMPRTATERSQRLPPKTAEQETSEYVSCVARHRKQKGPKAGVTSPRGKKNPKGGVVVVFIERTAVSRTKGEHCMVVFFAKVTHMGRGVSLQQAILMVNGDLHRTP